MASRLGAALIAYPHTARPLIGPASGQALPTPPVPRMPPRTTPVLSLARRMRGPLPCPQARSSRTRPAKHIGATRGQSPGTGSSPPSKNKRRSHSVRPHGKSVVPYRRFGVCVRWSRQLVCEQPDLPVLGARTPLGAIDRGFVLASRGRCADAAVGPSRHEPCVACLTCGVCPGAGVVRRPAMRRRGRRSAARRRPPGAHWPSAGCLHHGCGGYRV